MPGTSVGKDALGRPRAHSREISKVTHRRGMGVSQVREATWETDEGSEHWVCKRGPA